METGSRRRRRLRFAIHRSSQAGDRGDAAKDTHGTFWIAIAVVILQFDQASVTTVGVLVGALFLAAAAQNFVIMSLAETGRWIYGLFGVLFVIAGVLALISPENTFAALADMLGFLFLLVGIFWIIQAFVAREVNELWWLGLLAGIRAFQIRKLGELV